MEELSEVRATVDVALDEVGTLRGELLGRFGVDVCE
jgi:hypothetical protein